MKKLVIILICLFFIFSCASVQKSEVPNPATPTVDSKDPVLWYVKKVKEDPVDEILDWLEVFDVLPNPLK